MLFFPDFSCVWKLLQNNDGLLLGDFFFFFLFARQLLVIGTNRNNTNSLILTFSFLSVAPKKLAPLSFLSNDMYVGAADSFSFLSISPNFT